MAAGEDVNLTCNSTTLLELSSLCLEPNPPSVCYPARGVDHDAIRIGLSVANVVIIMFGVLGNSLTLLAIPYARRHQR